MSIVLEAIVELFEPFVTGIDDRYGRRAAWIAGRRACSARARFYAFDLVGNAALIGSGAGNRR